MPGNRIPLAKAKALAHKAVKTLQTVCQRVEVAGSIRRKRPDIGDIEIVCIPQEIETGLFGEKTYDVNAIYKALNKAGYLTKKGGEKYIACIKDGIQHDIFIATRETWGCIYTIRTGSADFTRKLVTQQAWGGHCPFKYCFSEGRIIERGSGRPIDTAEEIDVFNALGLDWIDPKARV